MSKRTIIFWTTPELQKAKKYLVKNDNNVAATARELSKVINRSEQSITFKLHEIKNVANPVATRKVRVVRKDRPQKALDLPKGFSFDFTPKRAEMFQDHVRLYF
jgi:Asp-tRNA(Asn)/Glu-tRNA(Gln) amidotransferase C subunit